MNRSVSTPRRTHEARSVGRERGQILVIFSLALVAIVAMTGLVLDGGSTFVQRRSMQNVSDAAALAAAYGYASTGTTAGAIAAANLTTTSNGYPNGVGGVSVTVNPIAHSAGWEFVVGITAPHANNFAGIVGLRSWDVSTTATTEAGRPNVTAGPLPIVFNRAAFNSNGAGSGHEAIYDEPGSGSSDTPTGPNQFNWTVYCNNCNADSNTVDDLIHNPAQNQAVHLSDHVTPLNAGAHSTLFSDMASWIGTEFAVPIVNDAGIMVGWATFHLTGSVGGSSKQIRGYFVSPINPASMGVDIDGTDLGGDFGSYIVTLTN